MIRISNIKFTNSGFERIPDTFEERLFKLKENLKKKSAKLLKLQTTDIAEIRIRKHSIDARKKPEIIDIYSVDVMLSNKHASEEKIIKKSGAKNAQIVNEKKYRFPVERKEDAELKRNAEGNPTRPIIVGAGPAGLFCAYELAKAGFCPLVIERGMDVDKRLEAVEEFWKTGVLNVRGNVQFGEGGAGTFSDGKLNTMVKDKDGRGQRALEIFVENGACEDILYEGKPHIGTDVLSIVIKNMRNAIIEQGGEFLFETKVTGLVTKSINFPGKNLKISGVVCDNGKTYESDVVVLAIGHSARDTFEMLYDSGIHMEQKAFAVGLRVEHPQSLINKSQYGIENPDSLPPSPYKVTAQTESGRGVYSFCMCPGGYVVNASSEENRLVVNGMSYSGRDGDNANSAIVVTVDEKDFGSNDVLAGMHFQRHLEELTYEIGEGRIPSEYFDDFKSGVDCLNKDESDEDVLKSIEKHSTADRNKPCIKGEYVFGPVHRILPLNISNCIVEGMGQFGRFIKGFDSDEAVFSGVETRTSSPVRITRDDDLEALDIMGLYPSGEGAGYAGGITSAAMDGMKVAERIAIHYHSAKHLLRNNMKLKRQSLSADEKEARDKGIFDNLSGLEAYREADSVLVYASFADEADTHRIIEDSLSRGKKVFCPKVTDKKSYRMEFIRISSIEDLKEGAYGISEPVSEDARDVFKAVTDKTLMIMPGLCFDRAGNRIGYGAGYYDRFIKSFLNDFENGNIVNIAAAYDFQVFNSSIAEYMSSFDIPVKMIITDKEVISI